MRSPTEQKSFTIETEWREPPVNCVGFSIDVSPSQLQGEQAWFIELDTKLSNGVTGKAVTTVVGDTFAAVVAGIAMCYSDAIGSAPGNHKLPECSPELWAVIMRQAVELQGRI